MFGWFFMFSVKEGKTWNFTKAIENFKLKDPCEEYNTEWVFFNDYIQCLSHT